MSFSGLKKKIAKSNQFLAEKITKAKRTDPGERYNELSKLIDIHKHYYEDVRKRATACLEPGPKVVSRIRPTAAAAGSHSAPVREGYPHAELLLGDCFLKYGEQFGANTAFGAALLMANEKYWQLSEAKSRAVDEMNSGFIHPISDTLNQDIKEINHLRKKAESRRLTYDMEKNAIEKGRSQVSNVEFLEAQKKFDEAIIDSTAAMSNFLESEVEQIEILSNLISAHLSYHQEGARLLADLQSRVQTKLQEARSRANNQTFHAFDRMNINDTESYSPKVGLKAKYEGQSNPTPTCRALFDFQAENPFELSFHEGDVIRLIEQVDDNWYLGELHGKEGHFPTTYVEVLVPIS